MKSTIQVACSADGNYLPHAATMLASLFVNNQDQSFTVHFLHDETVDARSLDALKALAQQYDSELKSVNLAGALPDDVPVSRRFGVAAWFRVLLPELLPAIDRVLYLDVDLLIERSVSALWQLDLQGRLVAAVTNPLYIGMTTKEIYALGIDDVSEYFNSGVLLMDLAACRAFKLQAKVFSLASQQQGITRYADQDPLNGVLHSHRYHLDPQWNVQPQFFDLTKRRLRRFGFSSAQIEAARTSPAIVHFSGPWKPWQQACSHHLRGRYAHYRQMTVWSNWTVEDASVRNRLLGSVPSVLQVSLLLGRLRLRKLLKR